MCVPYAKRGQWLCDLRELPCSLGATYLKEELLGWEGQLLSFMNSLFLKRRELFLRTQEMEMCYFMVKCSAFGSPVFCDKL